MTAESKGTNQRVDTWLENMQFHVLRILHSLSFINLGKKKKHGMFAKTTEQMHEIGIFISENPLGFITGMNRLILREKGLKRFHFF